MEVSADNYSCHIPRDATFPYPSNETAQTQTDDSERTCDRAVRPSVHCSVGLWDHRSIGLLRIAKYGGEFS